MTDNGQPPQLSLARIGLDVASPELLLVVVHPLLVGLVQRVEIVHHALELQLRDERRQIDPNGVTNLAGGSQG